MIESTEDHDSTKCTKEHHLLCFMCGYERIWEHDPMTLTYCPNCQMIETPGILDDPITLTIDKSSLKVLTSWAEKWARQVHISGADPEGHLIQTHQTIVDRLAIYTSMPLTVLQELADARAQNPNLDIRLIQNGEPTED